MPAATCASTRFGFALEGYDAIGRRRERDLGDRPIETTSRLRDGTQFEGLDGLRQYLVTTRRDAVLRQFCRKLLGYALGRGIQLSDEPLLEEMEQAAEEERLSLLGGRSKPSSAAGSSARSAARTSARLDDSVTGVEQRVMTVRSWRFIIPRGNR